MKRGLTQENISRRLREAIMEADVGQRGRNRRETVRLQAGAGHGLMPLMAAREGMGNIIFHQAPPNDNPPLPTRPANELTTPN